MSMTTLRTRLFGPPPPRDADAIGRAEQRTLWGRLCRYWLDPVYYYLDLLDVKRRPSHSKVTWTVAFAFKIVLDVWSWLAVFRLRWLDPTPTVLAFLLSSTTLTVAAAGGLDGFKAWLKTKGGGTVDAFRDVAQASAEGRERPPATPDV